jgi:hypothetical protein
MGASSMACDFFLPRSQQASACESEQKHRRHATNVTFLAHILCSEMKKAGNKELPA